MGAFQEIISHMVKGLMFHDRMQDYFSFLTLPGYEMEQKYHYLEENQTYREVKAYYMAHHNKLLPEDRIEEPEVIPENWYQHSRPDVDPQTKRNAIQEGFRMWIVWEQETKTLYESLAKQLYDDGNVADAIFVGNLAAEVYNELATAIEEKIQLETTGYDLPTLVENQGKIAKKYRGLIKDLHI